MEAPFQREEKIQLLRLNELIYFYSNRNETQWGEKQWLLFAHKYTKWKQSLGFFLFSSRMTYPKADKNVLTK